MKSTANRSPLLQMTQAGVIAALYAGLTLLLAPVAFGPVQLRFSEMLTILPVFTPAAIPGLAIGCFVSNLLGLTTGANPAGALDLLFGPLATLGAALLTYRLRSYRLCSLPVVASLPPVILNALVIGAELTFAYTAFSPKVLLFNILCVGAGQLAACVVGGLCLFLALDRLPGIKTLWDGRHR